MAQRRKPRKNAPSRKREAQLLAQHRNKLEGGGYGEKRYNVTAGKVTKQEINYLVKVANRRLAALEKAGLEDTSNIYVTVEKYANSTSKHKSFIYNVNKEKDTIRLSQKTKGLTSEEKAYLVNVARNIIKAKTSTVKGTKAVSHKRYESFIKNAKIPKERLTEDMYGKMFKIWRDQIQGDKKDKFDSKTFKNLITKTNVSQVMTINQFETAMIYASQLDDPMDAFDAMMVKRMISVY